MDLCLYKEIFFVSTFHLKNENKIPKTYKEKEKYKELIRTGILKNEDDIMKIEENFEEALKNVNSSLSVCQVQHLTF